MNRYGLVTFVLCVLAGCTLMPAGILQQKPLTTTDEVKTGESSERLLKRPPALATACMARNLERVRGSALANTTTVAVTIRPLEDGGSELVVPTMVMAHAYPAGSGSRVRVWLQPEWFARRTELVPAMLKDC